MGRGRRRGTSEALQRDVAARAIADEHVASRRKDIPARSGPHGQRGGRNGRSLGRHGRHLSSPVSSIGSRRQAPVARSVTCLPALAVRSPAL
ncbi:hypothetical protein OCO_20430 [Mycobacterium intracellulare MOTT-02]|uniref:Uncharacterized protein n=2 Tax=Mycobacterium intracellulare TaxID=1767 RepID=X8CSN3_MYCIT|nr:hypothetical protein OCO_20430 [Mycobacterium intracellulare MOTT-02]AFC53433.1 hypothetical protein OCQ_19210 [Mycobacterium paraintracellulare]AFS13976.1 Hypothetical protein MIP_02877 [Mycobacterium intracellulare subsp. intracellulare MTCC 9506]AGP63361.1 hypothetical protein OEM_18260 [Mycobacterium intracellulare subsp. yongonense 05-1390]ASW98150.1 hypothetical protein CKJ67_10200 [Mycobacterium intracellulare]EUA58846.1 hypothetical protein I550_1990 [Mycobacterium intracellulare 19